MNIVEFDESVEPYVLPNTPSVLSIGRRCVQEGYHFVWLSGKHPYLITPKMISHITFLGIPGVNRLSPHMSCLSRA